MSNTQVCANGSIIPILNDIDKFLVIK